jgi:hypothetical protein
MEHLVFTSCKADPDVWIRENNDHTGAEFYEYVLIYTDDILAIGKDPSATLSRLNKYFTLKEGSVGPPDQHLGAKIRHSIGADGKKFWTQSSSGCVQAAVKNAERWLQEHSMKLPARSDPPCQLLISPNSRKSRAISRGGLPVTVGHWCISLGG